MDFDSEIMDLNDLRREQEIVLQYMYSLPTDPAHHADVRDDVFSCDDAEHKFNTLINAGVDPDTAWERAYDWLEGHLADLANDKANEEMY